MQKAYVFYISPIMNYTQCTPAYQIDLDEFLIWCAHGSSWSGFDWQVVKKNGLTFADTCGYMDVSQSDFNLEGCSLYVSISTLNKESTGMHLNNTGHAEFTQSSGIFCVVLTYIRDYQFMMFVQKTEVLTDLEQ